MLATLEGLNALHAEANGLDLLHDDPRSFGMARRGIAGRLDRVRV